MLHTPTLVAIVFQSLFDVLRHPFQFLRIGFETLQHFIHSSLQQIIVVEVYFESSGQTKFMSQITEQRLEERVDGGDMKSIVAVQNLAQQAPCHERNLTITCWHQQLLAHHIQEGLLLFHAVREFIEIFQDTLLHLRGRLAREGYRQLMTMRFTSCFEIIQKIGYKFRSQRIGFSSTSRSLVHVY